MRTTTRLALATAVLLSPACGGVPLTAGADMDPGYDFTRYTSYTWDEPDDQPIGDPRLENNPFFLHRLHAAIHWELATRGIEYGADGQALKVHHHAVVRNQVDVYEAEPSAGYTTEYGQHTQVVHYEEGTFLVDISDARTDEVVWRGWARLDLSSALDDPMEMRDQIDRAIGKMFESFPIPYGGVKHDAVAPVEPMEGR
ncbi:MAG: DUF4136 domain-containing protein [Gemmatimonadales bacterium]